MSHMINDQIYDNANDVINWSKELEEIWTGTMSADVLEYQRNELEHALRLTNLERASSIIKSLSDICRQLEQEDADY